jgi:hypothetical protein
MRRRVADITGPKKNKKSKKPKNGTICALLRPFVQNNALLRPFRFPFSLFCDFIESTTRVAKRATSTCAENAM